MTDFLANVAAEQRELANDLRATKSDLARRSRSRVGPPRDLGTSLRTVSAQGSVAVIAEVKRRSPAAGMLAPIADPGALALEYALGGAAAISVLTEARHFQGSLGDLSRVRDCVLVPVLRKDFVVDELQLLEAHAYGADAVLLVAELFDEAKLGRLLGAARALGLQVLVEAHEPRALERAVASGAILIGINQRDLRTLELDRTTVARLAERVPPDRILVAESGIAEPADVRALPARVDAILVGSALVGAASATRLVRDLSDARRPRGAPPAGASTPGARATQRAHPVSAGAVGGRFGPFGGQYLPETLMPAVAELESAWGAAWADRTFRDELDRLLRDYVGRPTPLTEAANLAREVGLARVFLKREDLAHTGAHKINNAIGQALLARRMEKRRVVAETGAGQHGVATATACALLGIECVVYMGTEDMRRQAPNVFRMRLLGAEVRPVEAGSRTLKDAVNEAIRDWVTNVRTTYYLLGSAIGPHPYPTIVRQLQSVIGTEAREQLLDRIGRLPDAVVACVGGGSNAIGMFAAFLDDDVMLRGVEAGGRGLASGKHAASLTGGEVGVLHGARTYVLQDADGQVRQTHSVSAGLDYPGVGPEHAFLKETGRVRYVARDDDEALAAFRLLSRTEGIIPALEPAHAVAELPTLAAELGPAGVVAVCLSGRGDKDLDTVTARP